GLCSGRSSHASSGSRGIRRDRTDGAAPFWEQAWRRGSVPEVARRRREARGTCAINGAGAARTIPVTEHEWPDWGREASRAPLSSTRGKRTWSISEIPVERRAASENAPRATTINDFAELETA